ncbi:MAG TPA: ferrous iron transporter B [Vicinamibacterales bacterium]|nr:ferrous iron transporter B [Vicinamibacterales bacterium]
MAVAPVIDTAPGQPGPQAPVRLRALLVGNPNTGKTTLFNLLCGARAKTSNFPGTTTALRTGTLKRGHVSVEVLDMPGIYDEMLDTPEARIVRNAMGDARQKDDLVIVIVDASNLSRHLVLVGQLLAAHTRLILCLNMLDVAERRGLAVDAAALVERLGVPVVPMVAARGLGIEDLRRAIERVADEHGGSVRAASGPPADAAHEVLTAWARSVAAGVVRRTEEPGRSGREFTERLDRLLTHPVLGFAVFIAVMGGLFFALFFLAKVPMELIDATFAGLSALVQHYFPAGAIRDLLTDGVIGGIAGTVVFLPQICFLFFLISLLEDTGYLARAAFVMDRFLHRFGLPGHAFVPLLTAHACALPGIMSTRLIPDRRDRLVTILVAPFMSCSARLPVFVMLTSLLFAGYPALAPVAFAGCFMLGAGAAFLSAMLFSHTILKGKARPIILELPAYQVPSIRNAVLTARDQGLSFLKTAGTAIMAICVVMWWLSAYPHVAPPAEAVALRAQASAAATQPADATAMVDQASRLESRAQQAGSFAGWLGHAIQPVFAPLGYDWQLSAGLLTSFLAREVFVSTMAVLAGAGDDEAGVMAGVRTMRREDGRSVFTPATSASALVFFVLAMQCLPTLAVTRRESGSLKWSALQLGYMSGVAYLAAFVVYQSLTAMGVS